MTSKHTITDNMIEIPSDEERKKESTRRKHQRYNEKRRGLKRFIGCDGEGWKYSDPFLENHREQSLMIFRIGKHEIYTGYPLDAQTIANWAASLPINDAIPVGFAFDWDITMILSTLPPRKIESVYDRESRTRIARGNFMKTDPVRWGDMIFDHIPGKLSVFGTNKRHIRVQDLFGCFQTSFLKSLQLWQIGTPAEIDFIAKYKSIRYDFSNLSATHLQEIRDYNELECVVLERLADALRAACYGIGLRTKRWNGAGALAQTLLDDRKIGNSMASVTKRPLRYGHNLGDSFEHFADISYYGGYFDIASCGILKGGMAEYDINSAYPAALRYLPCLAHAKECPIEESDFHIEHIKWRPKYKNTSATYSHGIFPIRYPGGTLHYPLSGDGWYWNSEIDAVRKYRNDKFIIETISSIGLKSDCNCDPFGWIDSYYRKRKELGSSSKGIVLKLAMNSLYGKCAQTVGQPLYANRVWAGLITSQTRAKIHSMIAAAEAVNLRPLMIATDAVYTEKQIPEEILAQFDIVLGDGLGEWGSNFYTDNYAIIQPGLHFPLSLNKLRTRGIPSHIINDNIKAILAHWHNPETRWEGWEYFLTRFISHRLAMHLNKPQWGGCWVPIVRHLKFGAPDKRNIPTDNMDLFVDLPLWDKPCQGRNIDVIKSNAPGLIADVMMGIPYGELFGGLHPPEKYKKRKKEKK